MNSLSYKVYHKIINANFLFSSNTLSKCQMQKIYIYCVNIEVAFINPNVYVLWVVFAY